MGLLKKTVNTRCLGQVDPQCPKFTAKELLPALKRHCPECGSKVEEITEINRLLAAILAVALLLVVAVGIYGAYLLLAGLGSSAPAGGAGAAIPAAGPVSPGEPSGGEETAPPDQPPAVAETGLHYWIELQGGGRANEADTFRTGQQIRLNFKGAGDGFLAVWAQTAAGSWQRLDLLPSQSAPGTALKAGAWAATPMWLAFAEPVKDERVVIAYAPQAEALPQPPQPAGPAAVFALPGGTERREDADGTFLVNPAGGPVARELILRHVPR